MFIIYSRVEAQTHFSLIKMCLCRVVENVHLNRLVNWNHNQESEQAEDMGWMYFIIRIMLSSEGFDIIITHRVIRKSNSPLVLLIFEIKKKQQNLNSLVCVQTSRFGKITYYFLNTLSIFLSWVRKSKSGFLQMCQFCSRLSMK